MTTTTRPTTATKSPRKQALELLQRMDPQGTYADWASRYDKRRPCTLWEAIRAARTLAEGELPEGPCSQRLGELLGLLSEWAQEGGR